MTDSPPSPPALPSTESLQLRREADLLWVTLDEPEKANAFGPRMIRELTEVYSRPWLDEGVRAILLNANGRHFCAGADLAHLESLQRATLKDNREDSRGLRTLFESVLRQQTLTLALVHGACVAGGCGLATACDFVFAAEDARFMYSEARIGFVAALVATYLPLRLRGADLRELLLAPDFVSAQRALTIGLVNRVAPRAELASQGEEFAAKTLRHASPASIAQTKELLLELIGRSLDSALEHAVELNAQSRSTADCRRGIRHFLEHRRPPQWRQDPDSI
ncbi:MAG: enoyl-CoA hydratase-related protein [Acidobacteriota bacterium]